MVEAVDVVHDPAFNSFRTVGEALDHIRATHLQKYDWLIDRLQPDVGRCRSRRSTATNSI